MSKSSEIYKKLFDHSPDLVCVAGLDGSFKQINSRFSEILGHAPEDMLKHSFLEFVHADDRAATEAQMIKLAEGTTVFNLEARYTCKDGSYKLIEWSFAPVIKEGVLFATGRDISRKRHKEEVFLEIILDNIPDMIFVKEAKELRFVRFNKAGENLLGYSKQDLLGKNDYDFFPKSEADFFTSKDHQVISSGTMLTIPEEPIKTARGSRVLHTKKIPIYDSEGKAQYLVGISQDITERKQTETIKQKMYQEQIARQEAEKSLRTRDEFISVASHELKSPLASLKLQAQIFRRNIDLGKDDAYSKENVDKLLSLTEKQVTRLNRLVEDMLDVSRIRSGKMAMDWGEFNLYELVQDVLERMKDQFVAEKMAVPLFESQSDVVMSRGDKLRIEQVFVNLLTNALRYGLGHQVKLTLSVYKDAAHIQVKDQGTGISKEKIDMIFDRFERGVNPNEVSGLGLGLYITRKILEAHHGKIWVESELNKGSTFHVILPLLPPAPLD